MNKTERLYNILRGLESNINRLRQDSARCESTNVDIYWKWVRYKPGTSDLSDIELHKDMSITECNILRVVENERHMKHQCALLGKLLYQYNLLLQDDLYRLFA